MLFVIPYSGLFLNFCDEANNAINSATIQIINAQKLKFTIIMLVIVYTVSMEKTSYTVFLVFALFINIALFIVQ